MRILFWSARWRITGDLKKCASFILIKTKRITLRSICLCMAWAILYDNSSLKENSFHSISPVVSIGNNNRFDQHFTIRTRPWHFGNSINYNSNNYPTSVWLFVSVQWEMKPSISRFRSCNKWGYRPKRIKKDLIKIYCPKWWNIEYAFYQNKFCQITTKSVENSI